MNDNLENNKKNDAPLVVGLGASAGGLNALKTFFSSLPDETGMAFIVIVHLAPDHESNMAELLQMQTSLEVLQVNEKVDIKSEHVYVIPPNKLLEVGDNHLELSEPEQKHGLATIDFFFRSLAKTKQDHAVSIILSGTGGDGTVGMKAVKEHGGLTVVQDPEEAQYPGMPQSAIESGLADMILPVETMAKELLNYKESLSRINIEEGDEKVHEQILQQILGEVHEQTSHDFSNYKRASVLRRIKRRMQVNGITTLADYYSYMEEHPNEAKELLKDLLISVTSFFRDPQAFKALQKKIIPKLFKNNERGEQMRVWVPACATGEEVYSIAILLDEYAQGVDRPPVIKVFGTDIDKAALEVARKGRYSQSISEEVSPERINRYFDREGAEYQVKKEIREMILFARHDLLRDPPFAKLDLLACRNLLIYLNRKLQSEVFNLFHYTLKAEGCLFLGSSDSNLEALELFSTLDKKHRLYQRTTVSNTNQQLPRLPLRFSKEQRASYQFKRLSQQSSDFEAFHHSLLTRMFAPQSAIINDNFQVVHATEGIRKFLEYSGGEPSHEILEMVKPEIRQPLRRLLFQSNQEEAQTLRKKIRLTGNDKPVWIELIVHPIHESDFSDGMIQVIFKEIEELPKGSSKSNKANKNGETDEDEEIISTLEDELEYTKEQLQVTVEEYETSNEELRASNEELQSMNEELQSATEELETSQEELQSTNDELKTVNGQLESKIDKLDRANSDLKNLMNTTEIGIMFVDGDLCIQRFTSLITEIFNLIPSDQGRPLDHVTHKLEYNSILDDIRQVLHSFQNSEQLLSSTDGRWYLMRMRPYRSIEDKIEGVVLSFVEFTKLKEAEDKLSKKARQEEALARLGLYAISGKELGEVAHRAMQLVCETLDLEYCLLYQLNEKGNMFQLQEAFGSGFEGDCPKDISISNDTKWDVGFTYENSGFLVVDDYQSEQRFSLLPHVKDVGIACGINLMVEGSDKPYGILSAYSGSERVFSDHDINFLKVIANLIGETNDRKRNRKLQDEIKQNRQHQREIINNSMAERWELGSYLHDNLAQTLVSAKIIIADLKEKFKDDEGNIRLQIDQINDIIDDGISGIRDLTHDIIPIDIEEEGVVHAFHFLMKRTRQLHDIDCTLETDEVINEIKNLELATNLYHVVQEALKNAALHGQADNIKVVVKKSNDDLVFTVEDDGVGLSHTSDKNNGRGLRIIRYRMELLGGTFAIKDLSGSGQSGTLLTCTMPLQLLTKTKNK